MLTSYVFPFKKNQRGFALIVVLITLLILAGVVASMLRGQTLKLRETGGYFVMNEQALVSHNAHRACLLIVKNAFKSNAAAVFNWTPTVSVPNGTCTVVAAVPVPLLGGAPVFWQQPNLIVTTTANGLLETSEILYPACNLFNVGCVQSAAVITLSNGAVVSPLILQGGAVQVGWRGP
ncbi:hypothetical protein DTO96_101401 [Ephemeroptericola cinctiostellae]|uniref:Type 4 fimbrial biogenesis protein PilX N-terminal domain-containing protein n=1 Tax=Ephemeroptericola cinctiostellae TaxID=2268024 RepID=A0A345DBD2_9BURK|nr:hypothetical protein [Ephemeroptericola cinctiostellae]AXF85670.1 hypothetical protein DTO96_101401 [Ephemeroptericola cinctiostellae]